MRGLYSYTSLGFIVSSLFIDMNSYGQARPGTLANGLIPDVTPPSSEAAGLAKYGDYDVSYYTGLPQINIPIYTINAGSLSVPIGISYHGAGVKVDDVESWVGVNWSLNAGGVISRTVVGLPDENLHGFLYQNRNGFPLAASYNCALKEDYVFFRKIMDKEMDTEPDLFYFNFGQYSGKFFFDENGKFQRSARARPDSRSLRSASRPDGNGSRLRPRGRRREHRPRSLPRGSSAPKMR